MQRLEAAELRKQEEKSRRLDQARARATAETNLREKVAAATFARGYIKGENRMAALHSPLSGLPTLLQQQLLPGPLSSVPTVSQNGHTRQIASARWIKASTMLALAWAQ